MYRIRGLYWAVAYSRLYFCFLHEYFSRKIIPHQSCHKAHFSVPVYKRKSFPLFLLVLLSCKPAWNLHRAFCIRNVCCIHFVDKISVKLHQMSICVRFSRGTDLSIGNNVTLVWVIRDLYSWLLLFHSKCS